MKWSRRSALMHAQKDTSSTASSFDKDASNNILNSSSPKSNSSTFEIAIVEEVISNPYTYFNRPWPYEEDKLQGQPLTLGDVLSERVKEVDPTSPGESSKSLKSPWSLENPSMVDFAPPNSIKALRKSSQNGGGSSSIICFPFFSSHLSLPVKPGEHVWIMKFNDQTYYWMCRQTSYRQIEDVNFTFGQREKNIRDLLESKDESVYSDFKAEVSGKNSFDFEKTFSESIAYEEEFTGEPVPRMYKECSDLLIQGSNNSHIYLGKEKFQEAGSVSPTAFTTTSDFQETLEMRKPLSPAVDICVLRKADELFSLKTATEANDITDSISVEAGTLSAVAGQRENKTLSYYENEKARDRMGKDIFEDEFLDKEILNCLARIYMSNSSEIDLLLGLGNYEGESSASPSSLLRSGDYGAMVAFGTNTRVVGRETIKIGNLLGNSGIHFSPIGDVIIFANKAGGAKIVLEASGDIKIVPGPTGVIKLGSDNPTGGISATETATSTQGAVEGKPIFTTAGGIIGIKGGFGTFGKKVLIDI